MEKEQREYPADDSLNEQTESKREVMDSYKQEMKNYYKKKDPIAPKIENDDTDTKIDIEQSIPQNKFTLFYPYLKVVLVFGTIVFSLLLLFDKWIVPGMVHNKDTVMVPAFTGRNIEDVESIISDLKLVSVISSEQFNPRVALGTVLNQTPLPGTGVKVGRNIFLTVSKGKEKTIAPNLIGKSVREARVILLNKGFKIKRVDYINNESIPKDSIIKQSFQKGKMVPYGSKFVLTVSKGSQNKIEVPSIEGLMLEEVSDYLLERGFEMGKITYRDDETYMSGYVLDQYPKSGKMSLYNSSIDVVVVK